MQVEILICAWEAFCCRCLKRLFVEPFWSHCNIHCSDSWKSLFPCCGTRVHVWKTPQAERVMHSQQSQVTYAEVQRSYTVLSPKSMEFYQGFVSDISWTKWNWPVWGESFQWHRSTSLYDISLDLQTTEFFSYRRMILLPSTQFVCRATLHCFSWISCPGDSASY